MNTNFYQKSKRLTLYSILISAGILMGNQLMAQSKSNPKKTTVQANTATELLTNANVISLFKAGLSKSVILSTIQNSESKFDVSGSAIIGLKKQGLPDDLIEAIVNKNSNGNKGTGTSASAITSSSNSAQIKPTTAEQQLNRLDPGIYYADESTGKYTQLEASVFSQSKMGSGILTGLTYGIAKTKAKAVLSGVQANFQTNNLNPVFYFVFPHNSDGNIGNEGNSGGWYSNATSPNEFLMVKFKVAKSAKQKGREVVTGSFGTYSGFSGGIDDENKVSYRYNKLSAGVYKVYLESPLKEGEYAFLFAGTSASAMGGTPSQKAFDFSIVK